MLYNIFYFFFLTRHHYWELVDEFHFILYIEVSLAVLIYNTYMAHQKVLFHFLYKEILT
jgi:hypothetical protein